MKFGGAKRFVLCGYKGEKIRIRLVSDTLSTLQNDFKIKIDDIRKRIDVDVKRKNGTTEAMAKSLSASSYRFLLHILVRLNVLLIRKLWKFTLLNVTVSS